MEYVTLNNGLKMPMVGFGVFRVPDKKECEESVYQAIKAGYRLIDTAAAYTNEDAVGAAVKRAIADGLCTREDLFITSKLWVQDMMDYESAQKGIEASLEKSGLEYFDLYLLHQACGDYFSAWRAMETAYQEGKLKAIGVSNFKKEDIESLLEVCEIKPMVNQILLHISNTPLDLINYCNEQGIVVEAYSPIGHGEILNQPSIKEMADKYHVSVAQLCIRYTLQVGAISLPKTANPEHLKTNSDVDFVINDKDMETLKHFKQIENYGKSSGFPVYGGKL